MCELKVGRIKAKPWVVANGHWSWPKLSFSLALSLLIYVYIHTLSGYLRVGVFVYLIV